MPAQTVMPPRGRPRMIDTPEGRGRPSGDRRRALKFRVNVDTMADARERHVRLNQTVARLLERYGAGAWTPGEHIDDGPKAGWLLVTAWSSDADRAHARARADGVTLSAVVTTILYDLAHGIVEP